MKNNLNILIQSSDFYCPFAGVTLESLFCNNRGLPEIRVFLISDGIKKANIDKLNALSAKYNRPIIFIEGEEINKLLEKSGVEKFGDSYATFYKLFSEFYLPNDVDTILYLDSDLVIDGSLKPLIDYDFGNNIVAMAVDCVSEVHKSYVHCTGDYYYNSGVTLFNLKQWKAEKISEKIIHHISEVHANYPLVDQDIINIVLRGRISRLEQRFNFNIDMLYLKDTPIIKKIYNVADFYSEEEYQETLHHQVIYHCFSTHESRPWCKGSKCLIADKWDKYLLQSPWKDFEKIDDNRPLALKIQGILFRILPRRVFAFVNRNVTRILQNKRAKRLNVK